MPCMTRPNVSATYPDRLEKDKLGVSIGQVQGHALQSAWQLALHHPVGSHHYIVDLC